MNDANLEKTLEYIIEHPGLHARWLNTLSYLEHVGSRKILKTQSSDTTDENTLRHAAEEARHAYQFKKMIEKLGSNIQDYSSEKMLCGFSANRYFQSLDSIVKKKIYKDKKSSRICYLYVTALVEERAGSLYPLYQKVLKKMNSPVDLSNIIKEEERHLEEMYNGINEIDTGLMQEFRREENKLFNRYLENLIKYLRINNTVAV